MAEYKIKPNIPEKLNTYKEGRIPSEVIRESHEQHLQTSAAKRAAASAGGHGGTTTNPCHNYPFWPALGRSYILAHWVVSLPQRVTVAELILGLLPHWRRQPCPCPSLPRYGTHSDGTAHGTHQKSPTGRQKLLKYFKEERKSLTICSDWTSRRLQTSFFQLPPQRSRNEAVPIRARSLASTLTAGFTHLPSTSFPSEERNHLPCNSTQK